VISMFLVVAGSGVVVYFLRKVAKVKKV